MAPAEGFVLILEGCDKTGKTTMATQLSALLQMPVVKFNQPGPSGAVAECMGLLLHHAGPVIVDRFHLGESVYGPMYRGTAPMNRFDERMIENELMRRGHLMVMMEDRPQDVVARFKALKEDFARDSDVYAILEKYDRLYRGSRLSKVRMALHQEAPVVVGNLVHLMGWHQRAIAAEAAK